MLGDGEEMGEGDVLMKNTASRVAQFADRLIYLPRACTRLFQRCILYSLKQTLKASYGIAVSYINKRGYDSCI